MIGRRLTKREQRILVMCLMLVGSYGGYNWVYKPIEAKSLELQADIESQQKKLSESLRTVRKAGRVGRDYDHYLEKFKQNKTNEQVMSSILSEIEDVAGQLKLQIADLKPMRVKSGEYYNRFSVSLTIDSEFKEIVQFLYQLQQDPHLFAVDELRFDKGAQRKTSVVKTRLTLSKILIP